MIIKASQRSGAAALAAHLTNTHDNEHVEIHAIHGFMGGSIREAFDEIEALSNATKCKQYLFSVSLSPPMGKVATTQLFERTVDKIAQKHGLENQPYVIVFHEKQGRRHAHAVWSRIDGDNLRAIPLPYFKRKLMEISKAIYLEQGWDLPEGHTHKNRSNPLNFNLAEWQQAKRQNQDPKAIKALIQKCWHDTSSKKSFEAAIQKHGYFLACGKPRRSFVLVDWMGEVRSLSRYAKQKTHALKERLGDAENLPNVDEVKNHITQQMKAQLQAQHKAKQQAQEKKSKHLTAKIKAMTKQHDEVRKRLRHKHETQRINQAKASRAKFAKGLKGLWHRVTGQHLKVTRENERQALETYQQQRMEMDNLIYAQLEKRQQLEQALSHVQNIRADRKQEFERDWGLD